MGLQRSDCVWWGRKHLHLLSSLHPHAATKAFVAVSCITLKKSVWLTPSPLFLFNVAFGLWLPAPPRLHGLMREAGGRPQG